MILTEKTEWFSRNLALNKMIRAIRKTNQQPLSGRKNPERGFLYDLAQSFLYS
jgi:hypothetical protein